MPEDKDLGVGEVLIYPWETPGEHVVVRLAELRHTHPKATAVIEVARVQGPAPTAVGPLDESEIKILAFLSISPAKIVQPVLETEFGVTSVITKRIFEHQMLRLEKAGLIFANRDFTTDRAFTYTISSRGIQYLLQCGLLKM